MKHSFYSNCRQSKSVNSHERMFINQSRSGSTNKPDQKSTTIGSLYADKKDRAIASRLSVLLKKYENDPETIEEIRSKVMMFEINRGIARNLKSKKSEINLTKEFLEFITTLEKR